MLDRKRPGEEGSVSKRPFLSFLSLVTLSNTLPYVTLSQFQFPRNHNGLKTLSEHALGCHRCPHKGAVNVFVHTQGRPHGVATAERSRRAPKALPAAQAGGAGRTVRTATAAAADAAWSAPMAAETGLCTPTQWAVREALRSWRCRWYGGLAFSAAAPALGKGWYGCARQLRGRLRRWAAASGVALRPKRACGAAVVHRGSRVRLCRTYCCADCAATTRPPARPHAARSCCFCRAACTVTCTWCEQSKCGNV